jgi:hypothetical protein
MAATIATTTVHVIGKCPVKGCKNRRRNTIADAPIKRDRIYTYTDWQIPAPAPYNLVHARLSAKSDKHNGYGLNPRPSVYLASNPHAYETAWFTAVTDAGWICTDHDRFMITAEVQGVVNEMKPCTAGCRSAVGPSCDCVCGGEGHGSNWG